MHARPWFKTLGLAVSAAAIIGCDGSNPSAVVGDGGTDRPRGTGENDGGGGGKPGLFRDAGTFEVRPMRAPPEINASAKQLVVGRARLLGGGISSCSNQVPASGNGDRWCAYSQPGSSLGSTELWVINVTKAITQTVKCDGTNENCRRLTDNLWTGQPDAGPFYPISDRFDGDTLIFHADAKSGQTDLYKGAVYAWRPGWTKARVISTKDKGILCTGHPRVAAAWCIDNITDETVTPTQFDVLAGNISDSDTSQLPLVARVTPLRANDASQWRAGFNRTGTHFAYSSGGAKLTERETLYVMKTEDAGSSAKYVMVGEGISRWQIAPDSKHWYYYRGYNYSTEGDPSGTFTTANFPAGDGETTLAAKVGAFLLMSGASETADKDKDLGIGLFTNVAAGKGNLKLMKNVAKPDELVTVASNIASASMSRELTLTMFSKEFDDNTGLADNYIAKNDGSGSCTLTTKLTSDSSYGSPFLPGGGLAFWADAVQTDVGLGEGWLAKPNDCSGKKKFAADVDFWYPVGANGMVYTDDGDGETSTLRYAAIANGNEWPAGGGTKVQEQVGRIFSLLQPNYESVIYQVGSAAEPSKVGIYAFSKIPFGPAAVSTDAGVPDAAAGTDAGSADTTTTD